MYRLNPKTISVLIGDKVQPITIPVNPIQAYNHVLDKINMGDYQLATVVLDHILAMSEELMLDKVFYLTQAALLVRKANDPKLYPFLNWDRRLQPGETKEQYLQKQEAKAEEELDRDSLLSRAWEFAIQAGLVMQDDGGNDLLFGMQEVALMVATGSGFSVATKTEIQQNAWGAFGCDPEKLLQEIKQAALLPLNDIEHIQDLPLIQKFCRYIVISDLGKHNSTPQELYKRYRFCQVNKESNGQIENNLMLSEYVRRNLLNP